MIAKKSTLKLLGFDILRSNFETIFPDDSDHSHPRNIFSSYIIDLDYDIPSSAEIEDEAYLFIKCHVNKTSEIGYNFFVEGAARFDIKQAREAFKDSFYERLLLHSGLSIAINCVRNHLQSISVTAPYGEYLLPAIDVVHLIDLKAKVEEEEE